jgi:hypothetical protein
LSPKGTVKQNFKAIHCTPYYGKLPQNEDFGVRLFHTRNGQFCGTIIVELGFPNKQEQA